MSAIRLSLRLIFFQCWFFYFDSLRVQISSQLFRIPVVIYLSKFPESSYQTLLTVLLNVILVCFILHTIQIYRLSQNILFNNNCSTLWQNLPEIISRQKKSLLVIPKLSSSLSISRFSP